MAGIWNGDPSEVYCLAVDLSAVGPKAAVALRGVMIDGGEAFRALWAANAAETAGEHGKHYPASIDATPVLSMSTIAVDVAPNPGMPQGGMSFEFGSRNQPPHLDGLRALDGVASRVERMVEAGTAFLFR